MRPVDLGGPVRRRAPAPATLASFGRSETRDGQHRARGGRDDAGGDATQEHPRDAPASVGSHDDEIRFEILRRFDDGFVRVARFDAAVRPDPRLSRLRHEEVQLLVRRGAHGLIPLFVVARRDSTGVERFGGS